MNEEISNRIVCGDAHSVLRSLPTHAVDCIVTSPPYYKQRDYQHVLQIGNENSVQDYMRRLLDVFRECERVLAECGTLWLNIGDKFLDGHLLGLPWRVALALVDQGWILRSDIIWHKTNAMPHSVKNRPTVDHEYIFLLTRNHDYYYDADAIREPHITFTEKSRMRGGRNHFGKRNGTPEQGKNEGDSNLHDGRWDQAFHPAGRNKRTVWSVPLGKNRDAHFAVFPEKLIEPCILAGCPSGGLVLDPFLGTGTVAAVAKRLGRCYFGIDLNAKYTEMAMRRVGQEQTLLFS
jgi:site-specific DNA-methyltransferase (adenine-specific)